MLGLRPAAIAVLGAASALAACGPHAGPPQAGDPTGNPELGRTFIARMGCGACHIIPGVTGADGMVGPPLTGVGRRTIIAGVLPNTPDNLVRWLEAPQSVVPGNAMPNMEIHDHDARDVAAYLYTLR